MDFKLNNKLTKYIRLSVGKPILLFILVLPVFFIPSVTHTFALTDLTDLFSSLFTPPNVSAQTDVAVSSSSENSQNMPLLETANNSDLSHSVSSTLAIDGGEALLPEVGPSTVAPDQIDNSNSQRSRYVVRKGDTFAGIAKMYDVSVNTVLWANDLTKNSSLKEGQILVILPISGVIHTVVKGENLSKIAIKYGGDINEISQFNDVAINDILTPGDQIIIPDGEVSSSIESSPSSGSSKTPTVYNVPNYSGYFITPWGSAPGVHQTQGLHGYHNSAVDYGMPLRTPLRAAAPGIVIRSKNSGWNGGYGNYVIIQHPNGTESIYGHMTNTTVYVGQTVEQGQPIGYSGNTGNSTGPHLHFEVRGAKNPFNFM